MSRVSFTLGVGHSAVGSSSPSADVVALAEPFCSQTGLKIDSWIENRHTMPQVKTVALTISAFNRVQL